MSYFGGTVSRKNGLRPDYQFGALVVVFAAVLGFAYIVFAPDFKTQMVVREVVVKEVPAKQAAPTVEVLVALRDIQPGERLTPDLFRRDVRPQEASLADKAVVDPAAVDATYTASFILAGTPLVKSHLVSMEPGTSIAGRIPLGYRAVAIPIDAESGVEGWVGPGSHVDVVWATKLRGKSIVTVIVENAYVLSAGNSQRSSETETARRGRSDQGEIRPNPSAASFATLLVSHKDAQKIQLAKRSSGALSLSLRGKGDDRKAGSGTMAVEGLLKSRDLEMLDDSQGTISLGGVSYTLRGQRLVRVRPEERW
jgi:pilus assembly protein CpaB